jgi:carbon monoxide dehydrogenase subunit G
MSDLSYFESRKGNLPCNSEEVYKFVTDLRNFERFVPEGTINNWLAERDSCSFNVSMVGTISLRLSDKELNSKVVYNGDALKKNDFVLILDILNSAANTSEVKVSLNADLNPMLKMMASKPIAQFLEMLVNEMEKFTDWKDIRE